MRLDAQQEMYRLIRTDGAIARRRHPHLFTVLEWQRKRGALTLALPGVYVPTETSRDFRTLVCAGVQADPNAILTGRAAAKWSFWPELKVGEIEWSGRTKRTPSPGFQFVRRTIPAELVRYRDGVYFTSPALTALDLVGELDGDGIDTALRVGATTLGELRHAFELIPSRRGNHVRALLLSDSRDRPFARSERVLHRLLRSADLVGWAANVSVRLPEGLFVLDVAFEQAMLAIETDGWEFHARRPADFSHTMGRHTALEAAGWRVLHFTWTHLVEQSGWVIAKINEALTHC